MHLLVRPLRRLPVLRTAVLLRAGLRGAAVLRAGLLRSAVLRTLLRTALLRAAVRLALLRVTLWARLLRAWTALLRLEVLALGRTVLRLLAAGT
ncbi:MULTISPECIES: hypothetical protein [Kribbella]|uniref:Uncharacterized protein n=1 Tax=Kribbella karoonensis TaxID=324851 RepID=A0ABP4QMX9_9ACTN